MSSIKLKQILFLIILSATLSVAVSCNSKTEDDETEIVVTPAIVAVKNFSLKANDSVMAHLDSVFFSIDLNTGVIFNADSLPKGIDVTRLVPSITFANTMSKAQLKFLKDNKEEVTVDYLTNPEDSVDFSFPVTLDITAQDGLNSYTYQIRVNVHTQEPDTLIWNKLATSPLPSRFENPVSQKTIYRNNIVFSLIEEYNGEYTLAQCSDLSKSEWNKSILNLPFIPNVESFNSTPESFWILDDNGNLYSSTEGSDWYKNEENWVSILGSYATSVLGIKQLENSYYHSCYPAPKGFIETKVEEDFPIYNSSALGVMETEWYPSPFAIIACGMTQYGELSSAIWAYDGEKWAIINNNYLPALDKPMMVRYVVYRDTPYIFSKREFDVWLLFGGLESNGEMNRKVYMSYDNGVNWKIAPELMQLPESMPTLDGADVLVIGYELSANLSDSWSLQLEEYSPTPTRTSYTIDGYDINWICPYLYIFGGFNQSNILSTEIWRGVIARLEFTPII